MSEKDWDAMGRILRATKERDQLEEDLMIRTKERDELKAALAVRTKERDAALEAVARLQEGGQR